MPADKDAAKRRRQARNRQERQNRQARTEGAKRASTRPSRTATETPTKSSGKTSLAKTPARSQPASGGLLGKLFPPRPEASSGTATGGRPARTARPPSQVVEVDTDAGPRGTLARYTAQPGGRAAVLALIVGAVCAVTLLAFPVWPSTDLTAYGETVVRAQVEAGDDAGDDDVLDDAVRDFQTRPVENVPGLAYPTPQLYLALAMSLLPLVITVFAVRGLVRPTRSRTLMFSTVAGVLFVATNPVIGLFFFVGVVALGVAAYQSSKADKAAQAASS
ncbi:hypothetical protein HC251_06045 [Iamia sp. SCSIO 61187]|uniref:hypothetical protein n=1 Tax=Iamia sp. SCSIO 61187 TaxID=2722752 RepID=UPI001C6381AC|nr:hypothetical protein [Iamia sp. SCSIO 61187]QYG92041.1 hypothetical protein HC251_06045 [Iamia sp. SCSIO 61187]